MRGIKNKPCPFCGVRPKMRSMGIWFELKCLNSSCRVKPYTNNYRSRDEAWFAWNLRRDFTDENLYLKSTLLRFCETELRRRDYNQSVTDDAVIKFIERKMLPAIKKCDDWISRMKEKEQIIKRRRDENKSVCP